MRKLGDLLRVKMRSSSRRRPGRIFGPTASTQQLNDLSAGRDAIVRRIGQTLNVALVDVESARGKRERPTNPDAFDLILRAQSAMHSIRWARGEEAERIALYEKTLRLDPTSILALTGLTIAPIQTWSAGDEIERAAKLVADAAAINPNHPFVLGTSAFLLYAQGRYTESNIHLPAVS